jgi:anti-sigma factor RsiW
MKRPSEEQFSAWLDGELPPAEQDEVAAWLAAHPEDDAWLGLWAADRDGLRALGDALLAAPVPDRLRRQVLGPSRLPGGWGLGGWRQAAMVAGLVSGGAVLGAGGHALWQRQAAEAVAAAPWVQRAAYAHAVYVPEPRHAVEVKAQEEHLARWLTRRIGVDVRLYDLREQGFELVGGRLLPDGAGKSAQLMYQDAQGARVTVYLRKPEADSETAFRYERQGELGLFYWVEPGCGYAIVGPLPKERLLALAQAIATQVPASVVAPKEPPGRPKVP